MLFRSAFAKKVHAGEITNEAGEPYTTVVQIGIGGSDLGPRAIYLALENWARVHDTLKMEAKFISNVDPDDAAAVLQSVDIAHTLFIVVSKSGTTLETLTNETFVKNAIKNAGLEVSKHMLAVTSETSPLAKGSDYMAAFFMDDYIETYVRGDISDEESEGVQSWWSVVRGWLRNISRKKTKDGWERISRTPSQLGRDRKSVV